MTKFDHVAIAVKNMDNALNMFSKIYGFNDVTIRTFEKMEIKVAFIEAGHVQIHLISPLDSNCGPIKKFLDSRGEGIHHVGLMVDDLEDVIAKFTEYCRSPSVNRIEEQIDNMRVALVSSSSMQDIIFELMEKKEVLSV